MTPTIGQTIGSMKTNEELLRKLREACNKSPIPTEEEAQALMPEIPWECWNTRPVDADRAIEAVRAMGRGA